MQHKSAIVLANGTFPYSEFTQSKLNSTDFLICCDGAANSLLASGRTPNLIIGDGDSLAPKYKVLYKDIILTIADQETNDLTKAIMYLIEKGYSNIEILGGTGKREDHTLGNISLLMNYHKVCNVSMITEYGTFYPASLKFKSGVTPRQQVSIFNFGCKNMNSSGLKYPIRGFKSLWEGTLNEATDDYIEIDTDGDFLVYITHALKEEE